MRTITWYLFLVYVWGKKAKHLKEKILCTFFKVKNNCTKFSDSRLSINSILYTVFIYLFQIYHSSYSYITYQIPALKFHLISEYQFYEPFFIPYSMSLRARGTINIF